MKRKTYDEDGYDVVNHRSLYVCHRRPGYCHAVKRRIRRRERHEARSGLRDVGATDDRAGGAVL